MGQKGSKRGKIKGIDDQIVYQDDQKVGVDDFELLNVLGRGSFGKVMQVRKKDSGQIFAMKVLKKQQLIEKNQVAHTKSERYVLQNIKHPFIINLNYAFQSSGKLYLILDYISGGELFFHLKNESIFSLERVRFYVAEIASALAFLHDYDVVYRDLKPENILVDTTGHVVLTDFGFSGRGDGFSWRIGKYLEEEETHTFCGTPEYLVCGVFYPQYRNAPEVVLNEGHGKAVDWWSLGTLMYEMLTGLPPFYDTNVHTMYENILRKPIVFPESFDKDTKSMLMGLLDRDPSKRLGSGPNGGRDVKSHPFFKTINFDKLDAKEIPPPWRPPVKDEGDISQFDEVFTTEKVTDSVVQESELAKRGDFEGFTFVQESVLTADAVAPTNG